MAACFGGFVGTGSKSTVGSRVTAGGILQDQYRRMGRGRSGSAMPADVILASLERRTSRREEKRTKRRWRSCRYWTLQEMFGYRCWRSSPGFSIRDICQSLHSSSSRKVVGPPCKPDTALGSLAVLVASTSWLLHYVRRSRLPRYSSCKSQLILQALPKSGPLGSRSSGILMIYHTDNGPDSCFTAWNVPGPSSVDTQSSRGLVFEAIGGNTSSLAARQIFIADATAEIS